jgi:hypothetical protein
MQLKRTIVFAVEITEDVTSYYTGTDDTPGHVLAREQECVDRGYQVENQGPNAEEYAYQQMVEAIDAVGPTMWVHKIELIEGNSK